MSRGNITHSNRSLILPIWPVDVYVVRGACCDLAGFLVKCDCLQLILLVDIGCLYSMIGTVEDDERIPRNVGLK